MFIIDGEKYLITQVNPLKLVRPYGEFHLKTMTKYDSGEWLEQIKFAPEIAKRLKHIFDTAPAYG